MSRFILSHDSLTCRRSPELSSTAIDAPPPDLPPVRWMDRGFAILGSLARHRRPHIRFLVHRLASLLHASFRPRLAAGVISPLRFANPSSPSDWVEDFHLPAVAHARHTSGRRRDYSRRPPTPRGRAVRHPAVHETDWKRRWVSSNETNPMRSNQVLGKAWFICEAPPFHHGPRPLVADVHARTLSIPTFIRFRARV